VEILNAPCKKKRIETSRPPLKKEIKNKDKIKQKNAKPTLHHTHNHQSLGKKVRKKYTIMIKKESSITSITLLYPLPIT